MKIIYTTDLHGNAWKYKQLIKVASEYRPDVVINGGDMLPNDNNLFRQKEYILCNLSEHFKAFDEMKIYYLVSLPTMTLRPLTNIRRNLQ